MIMSTKYFYDSLNIAVILVPAHKFFTAKYAQFPIIWDKPDQGISLK